ncbi:hypothetical protein [Streptomyces mirabilis]
MWSALDDVLVEVAVPDGDVMARVAQQFGECTGEGGGAFPD